MFLLSVLFSKPPSNPMRPLSLIIFLFLSMPVTAQTSADSLENYLESLPADLRVSVVIMDKDSTVLFEQNAKKIVPSASVIKVPILVELMYQTIATRFKLSDKHRLTEEEKVGGSGDLQYEPPRELTWEELAVEMIRISDNTATNVLIDKIGMYNINNMLAYHGYENTRLNRKMMDFDAVKRGVQNYTSAAESARMMYAILTGKITNEVSCKKMIEILLTCADVTTIPRYISRTIPVAHKTGTLDYVRGDVGIIYGNNPLVISVFVENFESLEYAEKVIGTVSKVAFDSWGTGLPNH
ncbi:MAG: beta-lactamase class A [Spirosomataceae bacterium]|jgi:beta-lactamase class A